MTAASSKAPRKPKPSPPHVKEEHATVPVRVSPTVHQFIIAEANWGESIDRTLRRLLHIKEGAPAGANSR
jgi:hypothetical protein